MGIPVYMFLYDDSGNIIKGGIDIQGREYSVEVLGLHHSVHIPTDNHNGKFTGTRRHLPFLIEKEIDSSSPYLYKALSMGQALKRVELKYYRINDAGQEAEYFTILLENVKVVNLMPVMFDIKDPAKEKFNHMEIVEFRYQKITWLYLDGNIQHTDAWNERATV
ncbi:type VI secretion system effector, Hcp1 family [Rahnella aceris]|jgi:type VI secretion system secreted protein Hcp|uniref:Type VI secretion system effector, Hcp1 family n=1 Tax=Rahnella sp. (strain Y9602) TaxID=2703885 RepID=A0A0H3FJV3_RAHSY|nr:MULTISPECIES: type VI secretion system tube protein TssD [Rahnella]AFE59952.1 type VI secretion system effector [Rahnella aquatilis HX2]MDP9703263.1 type VI secretion system secreted protein Hcp [Rahnella aquatilis]ADW75265.1 type VI secretion system effector, Hcp1 family [Rahnella aceris]MBU9843147.1 type VI secretion system tube protein Hcp [Rahnella aceris]MBU9858542.1 type VI secretion system tube protein Hcp [Rahnella aceris]